MLYLVNIPSLWSDICTWFASWFYTFAQTPGFAGLLAVVAAVIAYSGTVRNARKERWWKRAEYAMNLTLSNDESLQVAGLEMLDSLASKDAREQAFISAATRWPLGLNGSGNDDQDPLVDLPPEFPAALPGSASDGETQFVDLPTEADDNGDVQGGRS